MFEFGTTARRAAHGRSRLRQPPPPSIRARERAPPLRASCQGTHVVDPRYPVVFAPASRSSPCRPAVLGSAVLRRIRKELGWSAHHSCRPAVAGVSGDGASGVFRGSPQDRYGPTVVLGTTGMLFGVGYALISIVGEPWQLVALFGIFIGLGLSTHDVVTLSTIARWFGGRRGMMTGVVKVGTATGQMVLPLLTALLMAVVGWRYAALALGYTAAAVLLLAACSMKSPPKGRSSARPDESRAPEPARVRRSRAFWTLCATQFLFFPSLVTVPLHIAVHGLDLGMSRATAATLRPDRRSASWPVDDRHPVDRASGGRRLCAVLGLCRRLLSLLAADTALAAVRGRRGVRFGHGGFFTVSRDHGDSRTPPTARRRGTVLGPLGRDRPTRRDGSSSHRQLCLRVPGLAVMGGYRPSPGCCRCLRAGRCSALRAERGLASVSRGGRPGTSG